MSLDEDNELYVEQDLEDDDLKANPDIPKSDKWEESNPNVMKLKKGFEISKDDKGVYVIEDKVLYVLGKEENKSQFLDVGEIKTDKEHSLYYGSRVGSTDLIVTSDHEVLINDLIKIKGQEIGANQIEKYFKYSCSMGNIAPMILNETIRKYYQTKNGTLLINPAEHYKRIRDTILYYMDFAGQDEIADVLVCWILGTYAYPLFYWYPHILINAPSGSGKSKCAYLITKLSFRGYDIGASGGVTPAQIFRTIEANRGTMLFDEFERSSNDMDETQRLVNQIINASASRDAYVIRSEQIDKKWISTKFPIFCPKICCNITGINPTSLSRFIAFKWLKTISDKGKRKPQKQSEQKKYVPITEDSYLFMLENWKQIKYNYETITVSLNNRDEDNWLPLYAIARFIDSKDSSLKIEEALNKYVASYSEVEVETEDLTCDFFNLLYEHVSDDPSYYKPKDISQNPEINDLLSLYKGADRWIGKKLKLYGFKKGRTGSGVRYLLSKKSIDSILKTYFSIVKSSQKEITTLNNTNYNNNNNYTNNTEESVVSVVSVDVRERCSVEKLYKDDIISILLDKQDMAINDLISLGASQDTLDRLLIEGVLFEPRAGFVGLLK